MVDNQVGCGTLDQPADDVQERDHSVGADLRVVRLSWLRDYNPIRRLPWLWVMAEPDTHTRTSCVIRCLYHCQNTLMMSAEILPSPGANVLAAFPSSAPTSRASIRSKARPPSWSLASWWAFREVGPQGQPFALMAVLRNGAVFCSRRLSCFVDARRGVPSGSPDAITLRLL